MNSLLAPTDWHEVEQDEVRQLRQLSLAEGAAQYLALQQEFAPWLCQTEPLFAEERMKAMALLQMRLAQLNQIRKPSMESTLRKEYRRLRKQFK